MTIDKARFAREIPKAELHVHLEGTITPPMYARIAERNGIEIGDPEAAFHCEDFGSFLRCFLRVVKALRRPEDFADIAAEYLERSAEDNVRHVEFMLSPATQRLFVPEMDLQSMVEAVWRACEEAKRSLGVSSLLIFDMVRNLGESAAFEDIELACRCREGGIGVVGVGLGGDERNFPARDFERAFASARDRGLRRTAHAGEAAGPESVEDAVRLLGAERIGHGVAASGQRELQRLLRDRNVTIDACPTSNHMTGAVAQTDVHPLREFIAQNIAVTLSSDDPSFFKTEVSREYEHAAALGCGVDEIVSIARASFARSFLPDAEKARLLREIDGYLDAGITR